MPIRFEGGLTDAGRDERDRADFCSARPFDSAVTVLNLGVGCAARNRYNVTLEMLINLISFYDFQSM